MNFKNYAVFIKVFLISLFLTSCGMDLEESPPLDDELILHPVSFDQLPGWKNENFKNFALAFERSCQALKKKKPHKVFKLNVKYEDWHRVCKAAPALKNKSAKHIKHFIEDNFEPYYATGKYMNKALCTGYIEYTLRGCRKPTKGCSTPLYKVPPMMLGGLPPRALMNQKLKNKGLELIYVNHPVDAFFLEIQGSGIVVLPDGKRVRVGYAGKNGYPFYPVGKALVDRGILKKDTLSMQGIRTWLMTNPQLAPQLMNQNQSYVFFRELLVEGSIGAQGVIVTPERTLAIDNRYTPLGTFIWVDLNAPAGYGKKRIQKLMIAQDKGGAIKGPLRADFFWGSGPFAEKMGGGMKSNGYFFLILPKSAGWW